MPLKITNKHPKKSHFKRGVIFTLKPVKNKGFKPSSIS